MKRQMHLIPVIQAGPLVGSWRHPQAETSYLDGAWWSSLARTLEDAKFDAIFFADAQTFYNDEMTRKGGDIYLLDPVPLAAAVAQATSKIGIGITISSSFFEPYGVARALGTLDVLSRGRIAWNVVTSVSDQEAQRFGKAKLLPKDERYDRADEMVEACMQLWDSFPSDAYRADKAAGVFIDPERLKPFEYNGKHVKTQGPLTVPPSAQGRPVIMQAGSSERGREFAARWGEILFTYQRDRDSMRAFRADMNRRMARLGRAPQACAILPSIQVIVGETGSIAQEKRHYLYSLVDDDVALARTSMATGVDLTRVSPGQSLRDLDAGTGSTGALDVMINAMAGEDLTVIEAARRYATNALCPELVGTVEQVADQMQSMFEDWGADGFILTPHLLPASVEEFTRGVVPILQERGIFRTDYKGSTLREHLNQGST
jgi:FMN-dependent oxidoreductase (nitrilotriacetate monooxygenase family)